MVTLCKRGTALKSGLVILLLNELQDRHTSSAGGTELSFSALRKPICMLRFYQYYLTGSLCGLTGQFIAKITSAPMGCFGFVFFVISR